MRRRSRNARKPTPIIKPVIEIPPEPVQEIIEEPIQTVEEPPIQVKKEKIVAPKKPPKKPKIK